MDINPFPGLRAFDFTESHLFFGRESHVRELIRKLEHNHFVAIVGNSGSGKSSLVKAGLLPAIFNGHLHQDKKWLVTSMHPGTTPLLNLADCIIQPHALGTENEQENLQRKARMESLIRKDVLGLVQGVRELIPKGKNLLILLDQFEEIFRFYEEADEQNRDEASRFVRQIIESVRQKDVPIYVALTIRSDFLGDCAQFEGLPEAINDGHFLVPRMTREQVKLAITGPVEFAKGKIAPRLVQQLLNDLGDNPDQLPILQHALMRSWDYWRVSAEPGEPIDLRHYEFTGRLEMALSRHADEAYAELPSEKHKETAERIFKCLTVKGPDNRGIRRPTSLEHLCQIIGAERQHLLEALEPFRKAGRSFILPVSGVQLLPHSVLDISHESLMRVWERLKSWVNEEGESADLYLRLCESAALYKSGKAALWRNPELETALEWKKINHPNEAWARQYNPHFNEAMQFLELSRVEFQRETAQKKRLRMIRNISIFSFLVIVSLLSTLALIQKQKALEQSQEAIRNKELAVNASKLADENATRANVNASAAEKNSELAQKERDEAFKQKKIAFENASEAEKSRLLAETRKQQEEEQRKIAEEQKRVADSEKEKAISARSQTERLRLRGLAQTLASKSLSKYDDNQVSALLAIQAFQFNSENGGSDYDPVVYEGLRSAFYSLDPQFSNVFGTSTSEPVEMQFISSNELLVASLNGSIRRYTDDGPKISSGQTIVLPSRGIISLLELSPDGKYILAGYENQEIRLFNLSQSPAGERMLKGHSGALRAAAFSPDGKNLVTAGRDSSIRSWDLSSIEKGSSSVFRIPDVIRTIAFLGDGRQIVAAGNSGKVFLWNIREQNSSVLLEHAARATSLAVHPDGSVLCGFSDGTIYQFTNGKSSEIKGASSAVDKIVISPRGNLFAAALADQTIRIFQFRDPDQKPILLKDQHSKRRA